ncbi:gamma carbonic anhydrase family protein [Janibacter sp. LM]|uniref:gamma carbonic anhydrase family protein n=1 Tax=Janibacter sp. LM TaxID=3144845 RepID=UPI0031F6505A
MPAYAFAGVTPVVDPTAYVHPSAVLIGDVVVGPGCYVGPHASLRADLGGIVLGAGSNVQDGCVVHTFPRRTTVIGEDGHVGHAAVLHGCTVGAGALIGIGAVLLDGARVGERAFVGAGSLVPAEMQVPAGHLVLGSPAHVVRELSDTELEWKANGTRMYHEIAVLSHERLEEVIPLTAPEADRPVLPFGSDDAVPIREARVTG